MGVDAALGSRYGGSELPAVIWTAIFIGAAIYAANLGQTYAACVALFVAVSMVYAIINGY